MHTVYFKKKVEKNLPQIHGISHQVNLESFLFFGACPVPYSIYLGLIIRMNSEYASHIMSSLPFYWDKVPSLSSLSSIASRNMDRTNK